MTGENKYKYIDSDAPNVKINYSYSKYLGLEFIEYWKSSRLENLKDFKKESLRNILIQNISAVEIQGYTVSKKIFSNWYDAIELNNFEISEDINLLVKRFEVTKKIYNEYNNLMRPKNKENYLNIENYSLFGIILGLLFSKTKKYQYLNAHVKLNDILLGWNLSDMPENNLLLRAYSLDLEYKNVINTLNKKNIAHD
jgi:hypothetical protein